ncbi:hypothetical protein [Halomonas alkalicola]|uniref:hypothetical protein n=1 Tax=Halomonas alkalicola TaxID=1930622 RepID=UPI00265E9760|nr:hypothetical protein [Halomonas alkalicola]
MDTLPTAAGILSGAAQYNARLMPTLHPDAAKQEQLADFKNENETLRRTSLNQTPSGAPGKHRPAPFFAP